MKKSWVLFILASFQMYNIRAQNPACLPDPVYKDSTAGIYPRPYNDSTMTGGITRPVCIGQDYEYPLTVNIPDLITVPFGNTTITIGLESAILDTSNAVSGLPKGIRYHCNPGNCIMAKNQLGCVVLKGRATEENTPGTYDLVINLKLITQAGSFDVAFPGPFFPGKYFLTVTEPGSQACLTSPARELQADQVSHRAFPVPADDQLNIRVHAFQPGQGHLILRDLSGRTLSDMPMSLDKGENSFSIPVSHLQNGTYWYTLQIGQSVNTRRFSVLH
ncbi:MAG TPA: T9SS type A sorting domain-containing protein [Saprospiraceae bacterium]|nr:T9SS type A sorting domain-containing protein [Saprospiraceae bacterium]HNT21952.1 T9SS type A sorting domain-containing protein [Saprospiraceae bacterium]